MGARTRHRCGFGREGLCRKHLLVAEVAKVYAYAGAGHKKASLLLVPRERCQLHTSYFALGCLPSTCSCSFALLEVHTKVDRHIPHCAVTHAVSSAADTVDGAMRSPLSARCKVTRAASAA